MRQSPRTRRLIADHRALEQLAADSSIFCFTSKGDPPEFYQLTFHGLGIYRAAGHRIALQDEHRVTVELGAAYPRMMPNLAWKTPIFHPNISSGGVVCLGGYGTHWVPSLTLDEMCIMLWDMIRYRNYDIESPYNREAAIWARDQDQFRLPVDRRSLRDRVGRGGRNEVPRSPPLVDSEQDGIEIISDVEVVDMPGTRSSTDGITFLE